MIKVLLVLWPSFVIAGIAEGVFFTVIDPKELYLFGEPVHFSKIATYSIGFLGFWMICAASSLMTWFLQLGPADINKARGSGHQT